MMIRKFLDGREDGSGGSRLFSNYRRGRGWGSLVRRNDSVEGNWRDWKGEKLAGSERNRNRRRRTIMRGRGRRNFGLCRRRRS